MKEFFIKSLCFVTMVTSVTIHFLLVLYALAELLMTEDAPALLAPVIMIMAMFVGCLPTMLTLKHFGIIDRLNK